MTCIKQPILSTFYQRTEVVEIAKDLIGTYLFTKIGSETITGGMIIETEAYGGIEDKASHAYGGRRTKRTEMMYAEGGVAYVYLCYGLYPLLNVVTNKTDIPQAVLIRAIAPTDGIELMQQRRKEKTPLTDGPGMLTQALGITMQNNGQSFASSILWIEARKRAFKDSEIDATPRIGIDYAKEHALLPWRFRLSKTFTKD